VKSPMYALKGGTSEDEEQISKLVPSHDKIDG
jgi:hypothetical protein